MKNTNTMYLTMNRERFYNGELKPQELYYEGQDYTPEKAIQSLEDAVYLISGAADVDETEAETVIRAHVASAYDGDMVQFVTDVDAGQVYMETEDGEGYYPLSEFVWQAFAVS